MMSSTRAASIILLLAFVGASGCLGEELGPLEVTIVKWEPSLDAKNLTIVIRIVNTGDEPIWRMDIDPVVEYLTANETFHGYRDDPRGFASFVAGIWAEEEEEVLRPRSYSERPAYFHFDEPYDELHSPRNGPAPRYPTALYVNYETPDRGWSFHHFMCERLPNGEEVVRSSCRDPGTVSKQTYKGRPPNAVEIGEPLDEPR